MNDLKLGCSAISYRFGALDGVRGWAALIVAIGHFLPMAPSASLFGRPFNFVSMLQNLPVPVFFILSGFVITFKFINKYPKTIDAFIAIVIARWLRLMIPILGVSLILVFFNLTFNVFRFSEEAANIYPSIRFSRHYHFHLDCINAIKFGLWEVFFKYPKVTYIPTAWTMPIEFKGSCFLFVFLLVAGITNFFNKKVLILLTSFIVLSMLLIFRWSYSAQYLGYFFFGYLLAETYTRFHPDATGISQYFSKIFLGFFIGSVIIGSFTLPENRKIVLLVASLAFIGVVLYEHRMTRLFSGYISQFLGRISFVLYLIHIPLYCSFSSYLLVVFGKNSEHANLIYSFVFMLSIFLIGIFSCVLYPLERLSIRTSRLMAELSLRFRRKRVSLKVIQEI